MGVRMAAGQIDFWFTMGSTYSFLSVMRLEEVERSTGVLFRWRPFHLLVILQEMKHVPFADKPTKSAYMWRDIERRAAMYGLQARLPAPYPAKQSVIANLIATVGMREGWGPDFIRAAYQRWFQLGQETGGEPNISESLRDIGQNAERVLKLAATEEAKAHWAFSARPHSQSAESFSGVMTGSMMRLAGAVLAACSARKTRACAHKRATEDRLGRCLSTASALPCK
jgi:2-hydroxychromene-2-carboxylate isomerase